MDKQNVICINNIQLYYSAIERNEMAICSDVDGPRGYHTEWSESEREEQILYNITYMWNLEKWHRWTYLQSRHRNTDVENGCTDTGGGERGGMRWKNGTDMCAWLYIKYMTSKNIQYSPRDLPQCSVCPEWEGNPKKSGHMCTHSWFTLLCSRKEHSAVK